MLAIQTVSIYSQLDITSARRLKIETQFVDEKQHEEYF
jgi:hypothetical protein